MRLYIKKTNEINESADISCSLEELNNVVPSIATEIICNDILDYQEKRYDVLKNILTRLRYGGKIIITGVDVEEVCREYLNRTISIVDVENLLYQERKSATNIHRMLSELTNNGLDILTCRTQSCHYYIVAIRNAKS